MTKYQIVYRTIYIFPLAFEDLLQFDLGLTGMFIATGKLIVKAKQTNQRSSHHNRTASFSKPVAVNSSSVLGWL